MDTIRIRTPKAIFAAFGLFFASSSGAITLNQVDDFEDMTTQGWGQGGSPSPPSVTTLEVPPNGGAYSLEVVSSGGGGPGSKMVMFNSVQWAGDYVAAGITEIRMMVRVDEGSATDAYLRVGFESASLSQYVSASAVVVPNDGEWYSITLPIGVADLVLVQGSQDHATAMSSVQTMRVLSSQTPKWRGDSVALTVNFDNIRALSEPSIFAGWLWDSAVFGTPPVELEEAQCFGTIDLEIASDDTFDASLEEVCWGRKTNNANPARTYVNFNGATLPVVDSSPAYGTRPLVDAGGNLLEVFVPDDFGAEDRVATLLAEPTGSDLLLLGGYEARPFEGDSFLHTMVKTSADVTAARVASGLEGRWLMSFFDRNTSKTNVNTESVLGGIWTFDLQPGGVCTFVESQVFQDSDYDTDSETFVLVQLDFGGGDLTNRAAIAQLSDTTQTACTYGIDGDDYLAMSFTRTTTSGAEAIDFRFVISDDNNYLVSAPDAGAVEDNPTSLSVGFREPAALDPSDIDGNYLFYFHSTEYFATGTGHTLGNVGFQSFDFQGRGMITFDSMQAGVAPPGQGGTWYACDIEMVQNEVLDRANGQPAVPNVTVDIDTDTEVVPFTGCDYSVAADGALLLNVEVTDPGEPAEDVLLEGYVNDNGELFSLIHFYADPGVSVNFNDAGGIRHIIGMQYTGDPSANADMDENSNLKEFQLPLPAPDVLPIAVPLPDVNSDGVEDVGVVRDGSILAEVRSGANGALLKNLEFFSDAFTPITAAALPDADGNGVAELAVLATRNSDGRIAVEMRNITGAENPRTVWFAANHTPVAMTVVDSDADGNGVVELAVLSQRNSDGRGLVEVKNAFGATNPKAIWAGAGLTSTHVELIPDKDSNGIDEIAILSTRDSDGRIVAEIKNAAGATLPTAVWFAPGHTAIDITAVDDKDANGVPEVAVLSTRNSDGRNVVEIKNAAGATAPSAVWFAPGHTAMQVEQFHDEDGNGVSEVAVLSTRDSDGRILVEIKNVTGATLPNALWYPPAYTARNFATIADTDGNGIDEALVLLIRNSDGRIRVQGRNAAGAPLPKDFWFLP